MMVLFFVTLAFVFYVVAGYPLLLWLLARCTRRLPVPPAQPQLLSIAVLLPVRDGAAFLAAKLENLLSLPYPGPKLDIIVISDGSTDATDCIAAGFASRGVRLLRQEPSGKAAALNLALSHASSDLLLYTDVRQELSHDCLLQIVPWFSQQEIGLVTGELVIRGANSPEEVSVGHYWKYEKNIRYLLSDVGSFVLASGCLYLMRRSLARPLPDDTLADDAVLAVHSLLAGKRNLFLPSAKAYDFPTQIQNEFPRKVRSLAGIYQMWFAFPALRNPFTPIGFHFLSYKASRLLLPYALLTLLVCSFFLPSPLAWLLVTGQITCYGLALLDWSGFPVGPLSRIASPVRVFLTLMLAAVAAVQIFYTPARKLWKTTVVTRS